MSDATVQLQFVPLEGPTDQWSVPYGTNLREALLKRGHSPYVQLTQKWNCGGNGICATCGVGIKEDPPPVHWHDYLARRFNYPRLSCQITVQKPLRIYQVDKWIWGKVIKKP